VAARKPGPAERDASRGQRPSTVADARADCDPQRCPCDDVACSLSRYARATASAAGRTPAGERTLEATEGAVANRLEDLSIDMSAMAAVSNLYRAANALRNHLERSVLSAHDLTWTGWVVLWVIWIWGEIETRHVAAEAGISKGTLTGVQSTLVDRGLVRRAVHPADARRVLLSLTPAGIDLMTELFPVFNEQERFVVSDLDEDGVLQLARSLRSVVRKVEADRL
jgi:MarR family transcriptional regulator, organic hydroperoxide resistance regulator